MFRTAEPNPLSQVFLDKNDPRIDFFKAALSAEELKVLLDLRQRLFLGTRFSDSKVIGLSDTFSFIKPAGTCGMPARSVETVPVLKALFQLFSLVNREHRALISHSLLREKGCSFEVSIRLLSLFIFGLGVCCAFLASAMQKDAAREKVLQAAINAGECKWVKDACEGYIGKRDCYLPRDLCTPSGIYTIFVMVVAVSAFIKWSVAFTSERGALVSKLMAPELNHNPKYDALLNSLCEKNGCAIPANWSAKMYVNGDEYTLRSLVLLVLASFHSELYPRIFSELIPACAGREAFHFGKEYRIEIAPIPRPAMRSTAIYPGGHAPIAVEAGQAPPLG